MDPLYTAASTLYLLSLFCLPRDLLLASPADRVDYKEESNHLSFLFLLDSWFQTEDPQFIVTTVHTLPSEMWMIWTGSSIYGFLCPHGHLAAT